MPKKERPEKDASSLPLTRSPLLGAHLSIAGGIDKAVLRGVEIGCNTIQVFTKSANAWAAKPLEEEAILSFLDNQERTGIRPVLAHISYLINLASPDKALHRRSIDAFRSELERAERLHIPYFITHPGSHMGAGDEEGLARVADSINIIHEKTSGYDVQILLETTAGQGSSLGYRFEHFAALWERIIRNDRIGVCYDTAHTFAAGYDIRTPAAYKATFAKCARILGDLALVKAFHLNDSKKDLGARVDRHEHIGRGFLGLDPFRLLLNDPRFRGLPMILETPKDVGGKDDGDVKNLSTLRSLIRG